MLNSLANIASALVPKDTLERYLKSPLATPLGSKELREALITGGYIDRQNDARETSDWQKKNRRENPLSRFIKRVENGGFEGVRKQWLPRRDNLVELNGTMIVVSPHSDKAVMSAYLAHLSTEEQGVYLARKQGGGDIYSEGEGHRVKDKIRFSLFRPAGGSLGTEYVVNRTDTDGNQREDLELMEEECIVASTMIDFMCDRPELPINRKQLSDILARRYDGTLPTTYIAHLGDLTIDITGIEMVRRRGKTFEEGAPIEGTDRTIMQSIGVGSSEEGRRFLLSHQESSENSSIFELPRTSNDLTEFRKFFNEAVAKAFK